MLVEGTYENAISFGEEGGMIGQILSDEKKPQQGGGTSERGFHEISLLVDQLRIHPRDDTIDAALRLYKMAVHRGFLKGRRSSQVHQRFCVCHGPMSGSRSRRAVSISCAERISGLIS